MKYDFTSIMDRRGKDAIAVDAVGAPGSGYPAPREGFDVIPMWVADMNFPVVSTIQEAMIERAKHGAFGYLLTHWGDPDHPHNMVWGYLQAVLAGQYCWNPGYKQQGGWRKNYFVYNSEDFLDEFMFGGEKVSRWLRYLSNYFLLEPERLAVSTMCANCMYMPITEKVKTDFFDVATYGGRWHFDMLIRYMNEGVEKVSCLDFDEIHKREIIVNCRMVVAGAMMYIIKSDPKSAKEIAKELVPLLQWITSEHTFLWLNRSYEKGLEAFLGVLSDRLEEAKRFL